MSARETDITEDRLLAYVDGQLSGPERAAIERHLEVHPDAAAEVAAWQRQNEALSALYAPLVNEPAPPRLQPHLLARAAATPIGRLPHLAAAALVVLALGGALGWIGRDLVAPAEAASARLIASAVSAHALYARENRHAVEVAASDRDHLVSWLSNRIAHPISAPDLEPEGFTLIGGRLLPPALPEGPGPAAQLMYENAASERVTVYITAALPDGASSYEFTSHNAFEAFYWANAAITCTVVGDLPEAAMQTVATKVYQQLTRRPDSGYSRG